MNQQHFTVRSLIALLALVVLSPMQLLAQDPAEGWVEADEGLYSRESEGTIEYSALGNEGHTNLLPIIQAKRAEVEKAFALNPSEDNQELLEGLTSAEDLIGSLADKGASLADMTKSNSLCTTYGATATTPGLACGNRGLATAYGISGAGCGGPFQIYAFSRAYRDCGKTSQLAWDSQGPLVVASGVVSASAVLTGAYSTCNSEAFAYSISTNPSDCASVVTIDNGVGASCGTNPFTCARCIRTDIGDPH